MTPQQLKTEFLKGQVLKPDYISGMHEFHKAIFGYAEFIKGTDVSSVEITPRGVVMTCQPGNVKILCDVDDERIAPIEILNFGAYEPAELNMILRLVKPGQTVFDVGANFGWYSLIISKLIKGCKIFAFEPIPKTFKFLQENIKLNGFKNITALNFGLSNKTGNISFYYYPSGSGNASALNVSARKDAVKVKAKIKTMDSYASKFKHIDFIKCDVEGAELLVFKGGIKTLAKHKPIIFTEMLRKWSAPYGYHPNDIIDLLAGIGYQCFVINGKRLKHFTKVTEETRETNYLFLHKTKHAKEIKQLAK